MSDWDCRSHFSRVVGKIVERFFKAQEIDTVFSTHNNHSGRLFQVIILGLSFQESSDGTRKCNIDAINWEVEHNVVL